ncbi:hypothetical protein LTR35_011144 [Friedmanniomyces endolithicus]|uniref:Uncharacterized protein n=1 Tax=Friedmanniomyces endolithicus TaxID=329885 RepID=A0AAN6FUK9_9PEZI|nr:hypothetical protein LTR35_011144 [Friedmanniomyces endolithicus]KAK0277252.1 hypothetical protein LTS00_014225 [Friedmanniomyces endolithicus]KAK0323773.1 hypothetical protein LTR82_005520 [Friedmanniomyces endolithicus]KAK0977140.1 hypothetical protein LTR54_016301 [Friedmanniomyces endolithicus]KAK1062089.1 hypothetical protein LTR74_010522 [Friedmanniomyces endolithicus]
MAYFLYALTGRTLSFQSPVVHVTLQRHVVVRNNVGCLLARQEAVVQLLAPWELFNLYEYTKATNAGPPSSDE